MKWLRYHSNGHIAVLETIRDKGVEGWRAFVAPPHHLGIVESSRSLADAKSRADRCPHPGCTNEGCEDWREA